MLQMGMTNPPYILEYFDDIAEIMNQPRVYVFLHRKFEESHLQLADWDVQDPKTVINAIWGFPTETNKDFQQTSGLPLSRDLPVTHINSTRSRAHQQSACSASKSTSSKPAPKQSPSSSISLCAVGEQLSVITTDCSTDGKHLVRHNWLYRQVLVQDTVALMGKCINVIVMEALKACAVEKTAETDVVEEEAGFVRVPRKMGQDGRGACDGFESGHRQ
ncbi:hypothetical protein BJ742DRAFT_739086 [Cladochytrium replicatum]|nr:hypothetical protein BJ742DRAFT_739086 [Cladochytrium replicatum]